MQKQLYIKSACDMLLQYGKLDVKAELKRYGKLDVITSLKIETA